MIINRLYFESPLVIYLIFIIESSFHKISLSNISLNKDQAYAFSWNIYYFDVFFTELPDKQKYTT